MQESPQQPQQLMPLQSRRRLFAVVTVIPLVCLLAGALWVMQAERTPDHPESIAPAGGEYALLHEDWPTGCGGSS